MGFWKLIKGIKKITDILSQEGIRVIIYTPDNRPHLLDIDVHSFPDIIITMTERKSADKFEKKVWQCIGCHVIFTNQKQFYEHLDRGCLK